MRPRSTAAVVLSRPDPHPGGGEPKAMRAAEIAKPGTGRARAWLALLTWVFLGAAIAALWALLLLGDSLVVTG